MGGLGDCLYQRPLIRHLLASHEVWLSTPYPEVYRDLPVRPVMWPAGKDFRCQVKNIGRQPRETWGAVPPGARRVRFGYPSIRRHVSIVQHLETMAGVTIEGFRFDLPDFGRPPVNPPYAVVRPVTVRREWQNAARNPRPEYVSYAAWELRRQGYRVICVGDIQPPAERLVGEMPEADRYWMAGELRAEQMLALVQHAALVVGPVGWIVPACLAMKVPAVIIGGGHGLYNHPSVLVDSRMDSSRMRFLLPEPYCRCGNHGHDCPREIPDFPDRLQAAIAEVA